MYQIIFCLILITHEIINAVKISSGSSSRGSSAARSSVQSGGNYNSNNAGGYYPVPISGYHSHSDFVFHDKNTCAEALKQALIGGAIGTATGVATIESGKAILRSNSQPLQTPNGRNYYFDESNYQSKNGSFMCSMPLDEVAKAVQESSSQTPKDDSKNSTDITPEQFFKTVQFKDGSRPKSLTWSCKNGTEDCCGIDCCSNIRTSPNSVPSHFRGLPWTILILV